MKVTASLDHDMINNCNFPVREAIERALKNQPFRIDKYTGKVWIDRYRNLIIPEEYRHKIYDYIVDEGQFTLTFEELDCYIIEDLKIKHTLFDYFVNKEWLSYYLRKMTSGPVLVREVNLSHHIHNIYDEDMVPTQEIYMRDGVISYAAPEDSNEWDKIYMRTFRRATFESSKDFAFDAEGNF